MPRRIERRGAGAIAPPTATDEGATSMSGGDEALWFRRGKATSPQANTYFRGASSVRESCG
jgi:hypothetical protein